MIFVFDRVENNVGKGENAGYQHFLLFLQCFLRPYYLMVIKSQDCMVKSLTHYHKMLHFDALKMFSCRKHCEKRRNHL